MVSDTFWTDVHSLRTFFDEDYSFVTPKYQREFVWKKNRVYEFLEDIESTRMGGVHEIFIGSIITSTPPHPENQHIGASTNPPKIKDQILSTFPTPKQIKKGGGLTKSNMKKLLKELSLDHRYHGNTSIDDLRGLLLSQVQKCKLIDGQQRLTTISIMSIILAGWAKDLGLNTQEKELKKFVDKGGATPRLTLRPGDRDDFNLIFNEHEHGKVEDLYENRRDEWATRGIKGKRIIRGAYKQIADWFDSFNSKNQDDPEDAFRKYIEFFLEKIYFIYIDVRNPQQENLVFLSLNATGELLTEGEKVKTYLFHKASRIDPLCAEYVESQWEQMTSKLDEISLYQEQDVVTRFLLIWARSQNITLDGSEALLQNKYLYRAFKQQVEENYDGEQELRDLATSLLNNAKYFSKIIHPPTSLTVREDMIDFRMGTRRQHLPIFMAVRDKSGARHLYTEELSKIYQVFFGRALGTGTWSNTVEKDFNFNWIEYVKKYPQDRALRKIKLGAWNLLITVSEIRNPSAKSTDDLKNELNKRFEGDLRGEISPDHAKYYLRKIEDENGWVDYDRAELQAEHIFPNSQTRGRSGKFHWWIQRGTGFPWGHNSWWWAQESTERKEEAGHLGNFLILEKDINQPVSRRTWKANTSDGKLPAVSANHRTDGSQEMIKEKGGKFHFYKYYKFKIGARWKYGSQINMVKDFCHDYEGKRHWTSGMKNKRTESLVKKALTKDCWSLDDWDIDSMRNEEMFDTAMDELEVANTLKELNEVEIEGFVEAKENELKDLKEQRAREIEDAAEEVADRRRSDQQRFAEALEEMMSPGERYVKGALIESLNDSEFPFNENDLGSNDSESEIPRWHRTVGNALRNTPDRTGHSQNWWEALRAVKQDGNWYYWIEQDEEE